MEAAIGKPCQLITKLLIKDDAPLGAPRSPVTRRINPGFQGEVGTEVEAVTIGDNKNIIDSIKQEGCTHLCAGPISTSFDNLGRLGANIKGGSIIDGIDGEGDALAGEGINIRSGG